MISDIKKQYLHCLSILLFASILIFFAVSQASALEEVTLQLKWTHQFQFAGYYAALQQGYYRDAGLDVTIKPATPGKDPVLDVIDGTAEYGVGTSSLLLMRNAGKPVVTLAVIFQHSPYILLTKESSANQTIHSLVGKRLMLEPQADELVAYLNKEGIQLDKMKLVEHSFNLKDLIDGTVDAISGYITTYPDDLSRAGFPYHAYSPRSAGIDFYGDNLFTTESELKKHPARVKAFREASLKGWQYAMQHPDEIINLIVYAYSPKSDRTHLKYEADHIRELIQPNLVEIGYMHAGRWQHIADTYNELGLLPKNVDLRKFMYEPHHHKELTIFYWIASSLLGLALLIIAVRLIKTAGNLKASEETIRQHYNEIRQINESLERRVEERTRDLRFAQNFELFRSEILELLADDVPLAGVLEAIVRGMEELDQTMLCSILLLDSEGRHLGNGIAPSLPDYYNAAIEGLEIGMGVGSCGTAAFTGERVIVDDIASHPYWASFKELAARADLGACWSQPFISSSNKALGTFAIYHHEARSPDEHEIKIIEQAAYLASIAIDKSIVSKALQTSEQRFRSFVENANDLIYLLSPEGIITYVAPNVEQLLGYQSDELTGTSFTPLIHVDELPACILFLQQLFESGRKMSGLEYRIRHKNGSWLWFVSNASPVRDPVTEEMSFSAIGHDITERKLMEKELCHKQMLLEDMNRVLKEHLVSEQQKSFELADLIKRLQNSEELYHSLVETSQDLIWRCDAEGKYTYLNLAWEHIFGYELDEMLGKEHCDFQTAEEAERYRKEFHRLLHGESIEQFETTFTGKSGNAIHLVFNALYVMDEQDEFAGASGTAHDITLRKQMENSLHESEEKHRILLEESGDAIFALTAEGRYTFVNRVFSEGLGKLTDEIIGKTLWDVFSKEEAEKRFSALSSVFRTGEAASLEVCIPHADGASYHLTTINPIRGINGEIYAAICSSKNVTELKNTEKRLSEITNRVMEQSMELKQFNELLEQRIFERTQELQASQSRIDQLCEQSGTMIWEVDGQGLYTYVNHVSKAVFGYSPEEMIGQMHFYDVFPESEQEAIKQLVAPVFENKAQIHNLENKTITKDGRQLFWTTTGIPMLGDDGTLLGYRGSDTDITESKKIKEQLIQSQKMEAVGQLAGGLAHDFNNVLSIINGYCCLMQMEMEHDETQKGYLGKIMEASGRAGELTHSMLAFSRTQVMHPQNQDLNWIVSKTGAFIDKIIGDNINFKTVIKEATLPVYADGGQIEQILINLSNNARDAMPNGGDLEIATHSVSMDDSFISAHGFGKPGRYAVITVSDSGTGMDAATRKKIFEPFFTTKAVDKGTGLGLAMVYGITKQHKGFVEVSSEPGQGARFMIYLPIVKTETVASDVKTAAGLSTSAGTETILVADDNTDVREFMSKILKSLGYQVILAVDGQDAVDKFADNSDKIHLIIMDMIMPLKSGKQAYDEIRQIKPEAMALFSSGYSANIIQQQGELGKNAEFISKPVQPTELMKKVREMLDRSF